MIWANSTDAAPPAPISRSKGTPPVGGATRWRGAAPDANGHPALDVAADLTEPDQLRHRASIVSPAEGARQGQATSVSGGDSGEKTCDEWWWIMSQALSWRSKRFVARGEGTGILPPPWV